MTIFSQLSVVSETLYIDKWMDLKTHSCPASCCIIENPSFPIIHSLNGIEDPARMVTNIRSDDYGRPDETVMMGRHLNGN